MSICYRCPVLLGRKLINGPSRDHQKVITQLWELETGNLEVWTCSENWRHWRNTEIVSYAITAGTSRHSDRCCSVKHTDLVKAEQHKHWEPKSAPNPALPGSILCTKEGINLVSCRLSTDRGRGQRARLRG